MNIYEFEKFIKSIKYKPGSSLTFRGTPTDMEMGQIKVADAAAMLPGRDSILSLTFKIQVQDVFNPGKLTEVSKSVALNPREIEAIDQPMWEKIIYNHLIELEIHEVGEFFSVGGRRPYDPHKKAGRA